MELVMHDLGTANVLSLWGCLTVGLGGGLKSEARREKWRRTREPWNVTEEYARGGELQRADQHKWSTRVAVGTALATGGSTEEQHASKTDASWTAGTPQHSRPRPQVRAPRIQVVYIRRNEPPSSARLRNKQALQRKKSRPSQALDPARSRRSAARQRVGWARPPSTFLGKSQSRRRRVPGSRPSIPCASRRSNRLHRESNRRRRVARGRCSSRLASGAAGSLPSTGRAGELPAATHPVGRGRGTTGCDTPCGQGPRSYRLRHTLRAGAGELPAATHPAGTGRGATGCDTPSLQRWAANAPRLAECCGTARARCSDGRQGAPLPCRSSDRPPKPPPVPLVRAAAQGAPPPRAARAARVGTGQGGELDRLLQQQHREQRAPDRLRRRVEHHLRARVPARAGGRRPAGQGQEGKGAPERPKPLDWSTRAAVHATQRPRSSRGEWGSPSRSLGPCWRASGGCRACARSARTWSARRR